MRTLLLLIISLFFSPVIWANHIQEPQNLDLIRQKLIEYHDSGSYALDEKRTIEQATLYLKQRLANRNAHDKPYAIVLDIDETSLTSYPNMLKLNFGGKLQEIDQLDGEGHNPVIKPTLDLYKLAKMNNVSVFFVTGRFEKFRSGTEKNLSDVGFANWDGLIMKPDNYKKPSAAIFKADARKSIENRGFEILMNIGDQKSDFAGGSADKVFKMPNPYYYVP